MSEWRDISTAPKDGTPFLIFSAGRAGLAFIDPREHDGINFYSTGAAVVGADPYNDGRTSLAMSQAYLEMATHWTPLPNPPEQL